MAEKKVVELRINSNLDDIANILDKINENLQGQDDELKKIKKSTKAAETGVKSLSAGFKGMGLAIKAIGIGLIIEAFNLFKDVLSKNQRVVDLFNTAIGALSIAFNDLIGFVVNNFPNVIKIFKDVFENPAEYIKKFSDFIDAYLIESMQSLLDTVGFLGDAFSKLFKGDFEGALESVKKAGKESIDILTGVNNSFDKGSKIITDAANSISDYAFKTFKASEANVKLQNTALLAAAQQARLVEQYDRQAEKLRQLRDNDLASIDDRIKANDELGKVLENQEKAMIAQASLQVQAAQNTFNLNKTIENQVALTESLTNKEGVLAQIEGFRSEQIVNSIALRRELIDLDKSRLEGLADLAVVQAEFDAEQEGNELRKLQIKKENLEKEKATELERLQFNIDQTILGTQARVDAELLFATKKQEINNAITTNEKEQSDIRKENAKIEAEAKLAIQTQFTDAIAASLGAISQLFAQGTAASKIAALAEIAIGTGTGFINALDIAQKSAKATGPAAAFAFPVFYATQLAAVLGAASKAKSILSTVKGGGGSGAIPSAPSNLVTSGGPSAPQFNVVGANGISQVAQSLAGNRQPIKAFVVGKDVSTQQALDRNIVKFASLG
jgi:hypothetical protein